MQIAIFTRPQSYILHLGSIFFAPTVMIYFVPEKQVTHFCTLVLVLVLCCKVSDAVQGK